MQLYRNGSFVADSWRRELEPSGGEHVPAGMIVPLARWRFLCAAGMAAIDLGVTFEAQEASDTELAALARVALIVLRLPKFTDGRAYSVARRLRDVHGFSGELRASGDVLLDQLPLLARCGFDAFEIIDAATIRALSAGRSAALAVAYQPDARTTWQDLRRPFSMAGRAAMARRVEEASP